MSIVIVSLIFRGEIANHTFFKALISTESKKQCFHFSEQPMAAILGFQNARHGVIIFAIFLLLMNLESWS